MAFSREPIKIIFLDIDGVICCNAYGRLEEPKLELLKMVCQRTGAKVVLSTDWRRVPQLKAQLISTLKLYGMQCIGATPCRPNWLAVRPEEIVSWMKGYASAPNAADKPPIASWVAVDDRPLLQEQGGEELRGHFVRTKLAVGLTERLALRMIDVLNGDPSAADPSPLPAHSVFAVPPPIATPDTPTYASPPAAKPSPLSLNSHGHPTAVSEARRSSLQQSYLSASSSGSGYQTPPPMANAPSHFAHHASEDAKAAAVRAYAAGRGGALSPSSIGTVRRSSVGTPPRFASAARSPAHVGGPVAGSAQWWNGRAAGISSGGASGSPARSPPVSVYGTAGAPRPRYAH